MGREESESVRESAIRPFLADLSRLYTGGKRPDTYVSDLSEQFVACPSAERNEWAYRLVPVVVATRPAVPNTVIGALSPVVDTMVGLLSDGPENWAAWHFIDDASVQNWHHLPAVVVSRNTRRWDMDEKRAGLCFLKNHTKRWMVAMANHKARIGASFPDLAHQRLERLHSHSTAARLASCLGRFLTPLLQIC